MTTYDNKKRIDKKIKKQLKNHHVIYLKSVVNNCSC